MSVQWADVTHNVLAIRAAPEGGSEQVSQAIMGDAVQVIKETDGYACVRGRDDYEGWALRSQLRLCAEEEGFIRRFGPTSDLAKVMDAFADVTSAEGDLITRIVFDTPVRVPGYTLGGAGLVAAFLASGVEARIRAEALCPFSGAVVTPSPALMARRFLGTPYLWGGTTPFGFDCSGLVQRVYSSAGVILPRDAYRQAVSPLGEPVPEGAPLSPGDLVFFLGARDPRSRGITHVGMMIDTARMIHAHGKTGVTIAALCSDEIRTAYSYRGAWRLT